MNIERMENLYTAVCEAPFPWNFRMDRVHHCGTPCCILGHYAARRDLQCAFQLPAFQAPASEFTQVLMVGVWGATKTTALWMPFAAAHFDIDLYMAFDLFSASGCGNAGSIAQAASYIRRLIDQHIYIHDLVRACR